MRFSAARYSIRVSSSWSSIPVTKASMRAQSIRPPPQPIRNCLRKNRSRRHPARLRRERTPHRLFYGFNFLGRQLRIGWGGGRMDWARILAFVTGMVDQELLTRIEYLAAENRILKAQFKGPLKLSDAERATLGEIGHRLGRRVLAEGANVAPPDTSLPCDAK